jgi:hypothetical protein
VSDPARPRYRKILERLDAWAADSRARHGERMECRRGCDDCCRRHLTLFPVEAEALGRAAAALPAAGREALAEHLAAWDERYADDPEEAPCPLLREGACLLYEARPVLCRTHGFPLLTRPSGDPDSGEEGSLGWCFRNFRDAPDRPVDPRGVLDMDRINRALGAVQALHERSGGPEGSARVPIRRALAAIRAPEGGRSRG